MQSAALPFKRVAVLLGGLSPEREVSLESGRNCSQALRTLGYDVVDIDVQLDVATRLAQAKVDAAFIALHGRWGEDGCMQGLLESLRIPYTGSPVLGSALAINKVVTKRMASALHIPTAPFVVVASAEAAPFTPAFGYPCVVKPNAQGSSVGVSIVRSAEQMEPALRLAAQHGPEIIVEQFIKGQEINVAVVDGEVWGSVEIRFKGEFYDYHAKYVSNDTEYVIPAPLPKATEARLFALNEQAYRLLQCAGAARIDWIVTPDGEPYLLEVNTLPGMTSHSLVPKIGKHRGLSFEQVVDRIMRGARLHS